MSGKSGNQDIARRYAQAFFSLAQEQSQIDVISKDLQELKEMLAESADLRSFIKNATLQRDAQSKALAAIGEKAKFSALTQKFLGTLAMKRRLPDLAEIISAVQAQVAVHKGEVTAEVTAAYALDKAQIDAVAAALKKVLNKTIKIEFKQDADIMGGLIIKVGSQLIDSSVQAKLERLHRALKSSNTSNHKSKMKEVA